MLIRRYLAIATLALVAGVAPAHKLEADDDIIVKGKRLDDDIIVEGSRKTLTPGLWNLQSGPGTVTIVTGNGGSTTFVRPFRSHVCLPADILTAQLSRLLVEGSVPGCSPLRGLRVVAGFRCNSFATSGHADYGGTAKQNSIDLRFEKVDERSAPGAGITVTIQSRLRAERT